MSNRIVRKARYFAFAGAATVALLAGCSAPPGGPNDESSEKTGSSEEAIIGGVAADSASLNAVGALVTISRYSSPYSPNGEYVYYGSPFCSATLIAPNAVLTAKHCVSGLSVTSDFGFSIGPDARTPTRVIGVAEFEVEPTVTGGFTNMGSDIAILHLDTKVTDIQPMAVSALAATDVGKRLVAMGYGTQDVNGTSGTRRAGSLTLRGTEGKVFELAFGSFEAFKAKVPFISDLTYEVGDVTTPDGAARARSVYDSRTLLAGGYEALAGNLPGDAQICHGDSGGPLIRRVDGKNTVFGVSSWVQHNTLGYNVCDYVNVFATVGPATKTFVDKALTWEDACDGVSVKGRCEGDVTVRCAAKAEGVRRALRTDCAELGQTCGVGAGGQVACVDP